MGIKKQNKAVSPTSTNMPPGGPIEIVFSFDTTGSMNNCIEEVRLKVQEVIERLFTDIPHLRVAVFAHGDYCDKNLRYVTKWLDFTSDQKTLCNFVKNVEATTGGDWEECYELVLRQVQEELTWTMGTQRSLVMIGDAIPHPKNDKQNTKHIDWRVEVDKLSKHMGVKIYSVQCSGNHRPEEANAFWKELAQLGGGQHLHLDNFVTIIDMILSICYRETGPDFFLAYEKEVRAREGDKMRAELNLMFNALRDAKPSTSAAVAKAVESVKPAENKKLSLKRKSTVSIDDIIAAGASGKNKMADSDDEKKKKNSKEMKGKPKLLRLTQKNSSVTSMAAARIVTKAKKQARNPVKKPGLMPKKKAKIPREDIPTANYLSDLKWENWSPAFQTTLPKVNRDSWSKRNGDHRGYRHHNLFSNETSKPCVYELAVQPGFGNRKYPVWSTVTKGFTSCYWDTYLTRNQRIQQQLDKVIRKNSKVFVRRAEIDLLQFPKKVNVYRPRKMGGFVKQDVSSLEELRRLMHGVYDYAWCVNSCKTSHRQVKKCGVVISQSNIGVNRG